MGNDGGSIPKRSELIRTKHTRARENDQDRVRQLWAFCALSKQPLQQPVVSCPLGRLYNKEAVIAFLLNPPSSAPDSTTPFGSDGQLVAGHIRSLKDVVTLQLTPNPNLVDASHPDAADPQSGDRQQQQQTLLGVANERDPPAPFVCPISLREMNGSVKFVYRKPCGCVVSDSALREMRKSHDKKNDTPHSSTEHAQNEAEDERFVCPVDGERNKPGVVEEWVTINPKEDELELMRDRFEARKRQEKEDKKAAKAAAKRKNGAGAGVEGAAAEPKAKKAKVGTDGTAAAARAAAAAAAPAVKAGATVSGLSATLAAKLAEQKKQQSPAIASLYAKKSDNEMKDKDGRSNWMTIGSYSRF
ncbi:hypothetical protein JCM10908_006511 [Rhodotorula pacifica]|uniref:uncharacterized protein n=1 Tax=Rhodotorula pacifica TaxID=1495444 RepID=UPI00316C1B04